MLVVTRTALTRKANKEDVELPRAVPVNRTEETTTQIAQTSIPRIGGSSADDWRSFCEGLQADIMGLRSEILEHISANQDDLYPRLAQKLEHLAVIYSRTIESTQPIDTLNRDILELKQTISELIPRFEDGLRYHPAQLSE